MGELEVRWRRWDTSSSTASQRSPRWLEEQSARPIRYEKVEPGEEQVLQQRELDSVDSLLALRREED
jgi:hypothetical protein